MSAVGRPRVLDQDKQSTVCSLVVAGVSIREAADFLDCDPRSIRREAQRNGEFRRQLDKAKSEARIHPLETLHRAAQTNWRAALCWMERLDPERFARPNAAVVTQREANQFVEELIGTIERTVSNDRQRADLFDLLGAAMPAAMRRRWDGHRVRRNIKRAKRACDLRKWKADQRELVQSEASERRRLKLFEEIGRYLPDTVRDRLCHNWNLLDPGEVFAERPAPSANQASAATRNDTRTDSNLTSDDPINDPPTTASRMNNASPEEDFVRPPRRNSGGVFPPSRPNHGPANDLQRHEEAIASE